MRCPPRFDYLESESRANQILQLGATAGVFYASPAMRTMCRRKAPTRRKKSTLTPLNPGRTSWAITHQAQQTRVLLSRKAIFGTITWGAKMLHPAWLFSSAIGVSR